MQLGANGVARAASFGLASSLLFSLAGAQTAAPPTASTALAAFSTQNLGDPQAPWRVSGLPNKPDLPPTELKIKSIDGKRVLSVKTDRGYGNAVHEWPDRLQAISRLRWTWRLDAGLPAATNINTKAGDDVALKVCVLFDMPTNQLSAGERFKFSLAKSVTGQNLPSATLCYVWDTTLPPGSFGPNPYSERVRFVVMASGGARGPWQTHTANVAADFVKYFGHESTTLPPVLAVVVGGDADNTQSSSLGYVGDLQLLP